MDEVIYNGCWGYIGHYTFDQHGDHTRAPAVLGSLDAAYCPGVTWLKRSGYKPSLEVPREQPEGLAALHHVAGWTVLSFWDRSVDGRLGSNSTFAAKGTHEFDEAVALARAAFPAVWKRFSFAITRGACGERRPT